MSESEYVSPQPSGLPKGQVFGFAAEVGAHLGYVPGGELQPLVNRLGGELEYQDFWDLNASASGSIIIRRKHDFTIFLASHTGPLRDRFTIGHELGHYFLHFLYREGLGEALRPMSAHRYGSGPVEWEANWFAAGFLMPEAQFRLSLEKNEGDVARVADEFRVSLSAAKIRADSLRNSR